MNKTATLTAVALAFDLGLVAVSTPTTAANGIVFKFDTAGQATKGAPGSNEASNDESKMSSTIYIKIDGITTVEICGVKQGKVVTRQGKQYCQLPIPGSSSNNK